MLCPVKIGQVFKPIYSGSAKGWNYFLFTAYTSPPIADLHYRLVLRETRYLLADIGAMHHRVQDIIEAEERYPKFYVDLVEVWLV